MRLPTLSIRWKMTLVYTGLLAVLLVAFGLFLYGAVEQLTIRSVETTFTPRSEQAMQAMPSIIAEVSDRQKNSASKPLAALEHLSGPGFFLQVRDQTGRIVASSSNLGKTLLPPPTKWPLSKSQSQQDLIRLPVVGLLPEAATTDITSAHFLLRSGLLVDARQQVVGLLQVAQSLFIVDEVQDQLIDVLLVGIAIALGLALLIGGWLAGRLLRPVARMTRLAQRIGQSHDLSQRIATSGRIPRDEVGTLAITFDTMLERLERAFLSQQQFIADAGHELKTPLTAILGHANVIRRHGTNNPELAKEALSEILEQAQRMHRLVEDLLILAHSGENKKIIQSRVSISRLVREVTRELAPLAREKAIQLTVTTHQEEATTVEGVQEALKRMATNLVDNALKFTPAGGQISVTTSLETHGAKREVILEVRDSGCGIAETAIPHIFERWYRVDKARTRATGGSGLGLSIVQAIVERHFGTVSVESQLGKGSVFQVRLPLFRDHSPISEQNAMPN